MLQSLLALLQYLLITLHLDQSLDSRSHNQTRPRARDERRQPRNHEQASLSRRCAEPCQVEGHGARDEGERYADFGPGVEDAREDRNAGLWAGVVEVRDCVLGGGEGVAGHEEGCGGREEYGGLDELWRGHGELKGALQDVVVWEIFIQQRYFGVIAEVRLSLYGGRKVEIGH